MHVYFYNYEYWESDREMLKYALSKCNEHESYGRVNVYAVLTDKRGRILAENGNLYNKSHPAAQKYAIKTGQSEHKSFLHAEIRTLLAYRGRHKHLKLYVASMDRNGNIRCAFPCKMCYAYIKDTEQQLSIKIEIINTEGE